MTRATSALALAVLTSTPAWADPGLITARYAGVDFRAGGGVNDGNTNYLGGDIFAGIRVSRWIGVEALYGFDQGQDSYGYPYGCSQLCCGAVSRAWRSEQVGGRALFVPLHTRFVDVSLAVAISAALARDVDTHGGGVSASSGCLDRLGTREVGALIATASLVVDVRPVRWLGLRAAGEAGVATAEIDWPIFHVVIGPVIWF